MKPSELRQRLLDLTLADLLGPMGGEREIVEESRVSDRYVLGLLAPAKSTPLPVETTDELAEVSKDTEDGKAEAASAAAETTLPSSMGMTFGVDKAVGALQVTGTWARYERLEKDPDAEERAKPRWQRRPKSGSARVVLERGEIAQGFRFPSLDQEDQDVVLRGKVRDAGDHWSVTLFLINQAEEPERLKDQAWLFQPVLRVECEDGVDGFLRRRPILDPASMSPDLLRETAEMDMLYRDHVEFAVGHGVATHAEPSSKDPHRAVRLETAIVPRYEVPRQTPPSPEDDGFEGLADLVLDMKRLSDARGAELQIALQPLVATYAQWIDARETDLREGRAGLREHREAAVQAIEKCKTAKARIQAGIEVLQTDESAAEAFRFANLAMSLQRDHTIFVDAVRRGESPSLQEIEGEARNHSWRPFQLAFVLLNLPGLTRLDHTERSWDSDSTADLLWFPTGGGKTEAYLGLTAYVLGLRRLQGEVEGRRGDAGVAVLMRYTLRLLTLQQFQRATALICACEWIRRQDAERWGSYPFRIGLWVGQRATPNRTSQAAEAVSKDKGYFQRGGTGSPHQITSCPWCGTKIDPGRDIKVDREVRRTLVHCGDKLGNCPFSRRQAPREGLPVLTVDEEIYRHLPSLVIATVDKFAQMPWNGQTQMLFGQVNGWCPRHGFRSPEVDDKDAHRKKGDLPAVRTEASGPLRPPDLIIQDELHLISGPLGSLVGLYETAIDELCSWTVGGTKVRPKVVASTATVRNARMQMSQLFMREVEIFPPPGTSIDDNFFSITRKPTEDDFGRLYLGICTPGRRLKALLIRTYTALMSAAQMLYHEERQGAAVDPWMTALGYFNSLRELGGMRRLVDDDVRTRLRRMSDRGLADRGIPYVEELTSRRSSTEIPDVLDHLEKQFDPVEDARRLELRKKGERPPRRPYDVVLATNMVSVGVDVKRLGLMVVAGQPKTTAEYIQATSRVGRHHPGLVVTVYNWARPRDLSHYERFEHYHATFYQRVEALSVTPFAARALDRGLTGILVSLVRLAEAEFNPNEGASRVTGSADIVRRALQSIEDRVGKVTEDSDLAEEVRQRLRVVLDTWLARQRMEGGSHLGYKRKKDDVTVPLLYSPDDEDWDVFTCLNSLRDVEPTAGLVLLEDASRAHRTPAARGQS